LREGRTGHKRKIKSLLLCWSALAPQSKQSNKDTSDWVLALVGFQCQIVQLGPGLSFNRRRDNLGDS
jgi:hypothetical protein